MDNRMTKNEWGCTRHQRKGGESYKTEIGNLKETRTLGRPITRPKDNINIIFKNQV
jgi:hypothetical protein